MLKKIPAGDFETRCQELAARLAVWKECAQAYLKNIAELQAGVQNKEHRDSLQNRLTVSEVRLENARLAVTWHREEHG